MNEKESWETRLEITPEAVELIVMDPYRVVLEARFCGYPRHPRALPFLLEGLALWQGERLCVVISAERVVHPMLGLGNDGDEWPPENALVEYLHLEPRHGHHGPGREAS